VVCRKLKPLEEGGKASGRWWKALPKGGEKETLSGVFALSRSLSLGKGVVDEHGLIGRLPASPSRLDAASDASSSLSDSLELRAMGEDSFLESRFPLWRRRLLPPLLASLPLCLRLFFPSTQSSFQVPSRASSAPFSLSVCLGFSASAGRPGRAEGGLGLFSPIFCLFFWRRAVMTNLTVV